ncbi:hypothetical protein GCM10023196_036970 [Actinoallomurus vinaceus]|uniref:Uncharacterized protein n=1 Tax=Actinoallomurus vinaceus TaxID=1080074 RepID=A0ABP8UC19_9ACTN
MSTRVTLPPGCYGLQMGDGTKYTAKPGSTVTVEDRHAGAIKTSTNGRTGVVSATRSYGLATKAGRWCEPCRFLAQAWATTCPRCGGSTIEETH